MQNFYFLVLIVLTKDIIPHEFEMTHNFFYFLDAFFSYIPVISRLMHNYIVQYFCCKLFLIIQDQNSYLVSLLEDYKMYSAIISQFVSKIYCCKIELFKLFYTLFANLKLYNICI